MSPISNAWRAVLVFNVVSGILNQLSTQHGTLSWRSFVLRRLLRIYPLYAISSLVYMLAIVARPDVYLEWSGAEAPNASELGSMILNDVILCRWMWPSSAMLDAVMSFNTTLSPELFSRLSRGPWWAPQLWSLRLSFPFLLLFPVLHWVYSCAPIRMLVVSVVMCGFYRYCALHDIIGMMEEHQSQAHPLDLLKLPLLTLGDWLPGRLDDFVVGMHIAHLVSHARGPTTSWSFCWIFFGVLCLAVG